MVNLYLAAEYEYRRGLAHGLLKEGIIDFCLADHLPWTEKPENHERIVTVNHNPSSDSEYSEVCDINMFPAIGKELLEKMRPYESMALKMGIRRAFSTPTSEYEEEKRKYLQHIRYWNYMLDKYCINLIIFGCMPHAQGKYVVYALAKIKGIPVMIFSRPGLFCERQIWGSSVDGIGERVGKKYLELSKETIDISLLDRDIREVYDRLGRAPDMPEKKVDNGWKKRGLVTIVYRRGKRALNQEMFWAFLKSMKHGREYYKQKEAWFRLRKRQLHSLKYYERHLCYSMKEYNSKVAQEVDITQRYILFLLQVYPEATIIPQAGVFAEQYTSVQLLARVADKYGIMVYVKEHPDSPWRSKNFYAELSNIHNVKFVKYGSYSSYDLMKYSFAVATQTGSCVLESLRMKKPVITFGGGHLWKENPVTYEMMDEKQGESIIREICNGTKISDEDIIRYFYAIQEESFKEEHVSEEIKRVLDDSYIHKPFPLEERIDIIRRYIGSCLLKFSDATVE